MKLSELLTIQQAIHKIYQSNESLPGPFDHVASVIINRIIYPQTEGIHNTAKSRVQARIGKDEQPEQSEIDAEIDALIEQLWDVDFPVQVPKIKPDWLPANVPKGTAELLAPILEQPYPGATCMVDQLLAEKEQSKPEK